MAEALGRPLGDVLDPTSAAHTSCPGCSAATAWSLTALVAVVVLVGCRTVLTWGWTAVLFGIALLGPLPVTLTGHSAGGGAHNIATDSLVLHVLSASLWVGGLVAVLATASRPRPGPGDGAGHRRAPVLPAGAGLLECSGLHRRW